jgi:predicted nucleotidyltransferase
VFTVELSAEKRLKELLTHLYVLIPVLDDDKHYYVGKDEVAKLMDRGEGWLAAHPERDLIVERYLLHRPSLAESALTLLYVYRVLLSGIQLMQTGEIEANLVRLNEQFCLPYLPELIERKLAGPEKSVLEEADVEFHRREFERLTVLLELAMEKSGLPEAPSARADLNDLLVRVRLKAFNGG